ncbi:hypothetical protein L484_006333 [Morus notabilis]|uniref:EF-hand domain-containing protein n=1 Tax=Morus notabilis TaxID=981085 RepID=W9S026_9ROSA|nr:hypothetical protein L484_006333 [Morus notabilis]
MGIVKAKNIDNDLHYMSSTGAEKGKPYTEAQLKGEFMRHSTGEGGRLSRQDLKITFSSLGSSAPGWGARQALRHVDKDKDGFVDEEELEKLVGYAAKRGYTTK